MHESRGGRSHFRDWRWRAAVLGLGAAAAPAGPASWRPPALHRRSSPPFSSLSVMAALGSPRRALQPWPPREASPSRCPELVRALSCLFSEVGMQFQPQRQQMPPGGPR